jgi:two-component system chemotaxis response regulator CheB
MSLIKWFSDSKNKKLDSANTSYIWVGFGNGAFDLLIIEIGAVNTAASQIFDFLSNHSAYNGPCELKLIGQPTLIQKIKSQNTIHNISLFKEKVGAFEIKFSQENGRMQISKVFESAQKQAEVTKVLIVDDSATIRNLLSMILSKDPLTQIVGVASHANEVDALIKNCKPDVLTVDIHMPEKDGVQLIKEIVPKYNLPCVVISSISMEEGPKILEALEAGAVDYIQKPNLNDLDTLGPVMIERVKAAASAKVMTRKTKSRSEVVIPAKKLDEKALVLIGSSTGGTEALREIFESLPREIPPIVVVQHIPPVFSKSLADRLNGVCNFEVREAQDRDEVKPNQVLIAPGGKQIKLVQRGEKLLCEVNDDSPVNRHKPSVDYMFEAATQLKGRKIVGVILTGMGADGAKGLLKLRSLNCATVAQDKETCVVYGMPRAAVEMGAAQLILPLTKIAQKLIDLTEERSSKKEAA